VASRRRASAARDFEWRRITTSRTKNRGVLSGALCVSLFQIDLSLRLAFSTNPDQRKQASRVVNQAPFSISSAAGTSATTLEGGASLDRAPALDPA
jgi:hypothetical protein